MASKEEKRIIATEKPRKTSKRYSPDRIRLAQLAVATRNAAVISGDIN